MTDAQTAGLDDLGSDPILSPAEAQTRARAAWRESGGTLTGADIGEQFDRSERWGRQQIAAARAEDAAGERRAADGQPPSRSGTHDGTRPLPVAGSPLAAGTQGTAAAASRSTAPGPIGIPTAEQRQDDVPLPLVAVTIAAVALVTVVCAVVSYGHIRDLALVAGMGGQAAWLPLGVDGLVVASSCALIVDHHLGGRGQPLAWCGVLLGLTGSLAANVLAVDPELVSLRAVRWVLAGYTPAALAVSGHLLFRMLGQRH